MNEKELIEGMSFVDEKYINEALSEKNAAGKWFTWKKASMFAASLAAVVMAYVLMPKQNETLKRSEGPDKVLVEVEQKEYELVFNDATGMLARDMHIKGHFWQTLTETELEGVFPEFYGKYKITATANYAKSGSDVNLYNVEAEVELEENLTANVTISQKEIESCYVLEGESIASAIEGTAVEAGAFDNTNDGTIIYYADFQSQGIFYYVEMRGNETDETKFETLVGTIITGPKADLSVLQPVPPKELIDEVLTLEEAYKDPAFGKYLPEEFPNGYVLNGAYRFINQEENYLMVSLSSGLNDIRWTISELNEPDKTRITSVADKVNYNLELYPIPRYDSVPDELREIVDNPIFLIEELTLEAVEMRSYTKEDMGDDKSEVMRFSVLYEDVLVEVSTEGISSEALYEMLREVN